MKRLQKTLGIAAAAGVLCMAASAQADTITSTLNLQGVSAPVATWDWSPGNAYAKGGLSFSGVSVDPNSHIITATLNPYPLYFQASLGNFIDGSSAVVAAPGLNGQAGGTPYQITAVLGFMESGSITIAPTVSVDPITHVKTYSYAGSSANFNFASPEAYSTNASSLNFVQFYKSSPITANNLAGSGFTAGTPILTGYVTNSDLSFISNFSTTNSAVATQKYDSLGNPISSTAGTNTYGALDQFGTNNYSSPNQLTVNGAGSTDLTVQVTNYDNSFFLDPINTLTFQMFTNTSNVVPFKQTDPSSQFFDGNATFPVSLTGTAGDLGAVNGSENGILALLGFFPDNSSRDGSGNILFQADANTSQLAAVPEPSTFVLSGLGLLLAGGYIRRRRA